MSRMPAVFSNRIAMNHFLWLNLAACQRAKPFQNKDHTASAPRKNQKPMPNIILSMFYIVTYLF